MKKYLLLYIIFSTGQSYSMDFSQQLTALTTAVRQTSPKNLSNENIISKLESTITTTTQYAIENSKNIINKQDMSLITNATNIRDINSKIIDMCRAIGNLENSTINPTLKRFEISRVNRNINDLQQDILSVRDTLNRQHKTPSKKIAVKTLFDTITTLYEILSIIKNKISQ